MELNEDARIDTGQVEDRRGSRGGGGLGGIPLPSGKGGWIGLVVALLVALAGGGAGLTQITGGGGDQGDNTALEQKCAADNALDQLDCRNTLYVNAIQAYPGNANQLSVMLELQADCYAGAAAKNMTGSADASGQKIFKSITRQDIQEGLDTAAAIGDDAIQRKSGGRIDESQFTHGTSAQRQEWFGRGHETGDPKSCDTFGNAL